MKKFLKLCPTFGLLLGFCPSLAVTTAVSNALGMGLAFTFVLTFSNFFVSLLRRVIPEGARIPLFIIIIVTFVTISDMLLAGFVPDLYKALGIFVPLIVVNCIILGRAEAFAYKNTVGAAVRDGLLNGFWFTVGLVILAVIREALGAGTLLGYPIFSANFTPILLFVLPPGGFLLIGFILAYLNEDKRA
ncbi:electron transport complex protein RnfE [Candidatus Termititenax persephonae]|uniref:Electron transport complex protein RnfE n=1 Tax=Candidatus Termititenax persephonae TaxID=2218525 RepID=A0A388TFS2_9BACT|nr:electron transport complex protein RnfE [Candidatus Termititenax persephonae]